MTTWHVLAHGGLNYFAGYLPMSGDDWTHGRMGGAEEPRRTARSLATAVRRSSYGRRRAFTLYAATGTEDIAYDPMRRQIAAMRRHPRTFAFRSTRGRRANSTFYVARGLDHDYEATYEYVYNGLPRLFR